MSMLWLCVPHLLVSLMMQFLNYETLVDNAAEFRRLRQRPGRELLADVCARHSASPFTLGGRSNIRPTAASRSCARCTTDPGYPCRHSGGPGRSRPRPRPLHDVRVQPVEQLVRSESGGRRASKPHRLEYGVWVAPGPVMLAQLGLSMPWLASGSRACVDLLIWRSVGRRWVNRLARRRLNQRPARTVGSFSLKEAPSSRSASVK